MLRLGRVTCELQSTLLCLRCVSTVREQLVATDTTSPAPYTRESFRALRRAKVGPEAAETKRRGRPTKLASRVTVGKKLPVRHKARKAQQPGDQTAIHDENNQSTDHGSSIMKEDQPPAGQDVVDIEPMEHIPVPHLAHGLDRVLFNPGVYYLQDPRSHVYNFDPYLQEITPVKDFNFDALTEYITSSRDSTLDELARAHDLKVVGSTSSMTGVLSQFHYFISNYRPVNLRRLSSAFAKKSKQFTAAQRAPASIYLRHNDGVYAIDADKSMDSGETVLSFLGRSMEKMLTLDQEEFARLKKENSADAPVDKPREAYHYSKLGKLLMRSQLDCSDPRLPGNGTFDLKTRAVLPVRMNVKNAHEGAGYQILQSTGLLESFEREYYDMIRAAFVKYSLQVRIGKMDGIFVAYHNTERIFGFQYISIEEMDECIHGSSDQNIAQREYIMSLKQLDKVLEIAISKYPGQSMSLTFEALEKKTPGMNVVIEPLTEDEIASRQKGELLEALKAAQKNERIKKMPSSTKSTNSKGTLEKMSSTLERMIAGGIERDDLMTDVLVPLGGNKVMLKLTGTSLIDGKPVTGPPEPSHESTWRFKYKVTESSDQSEIQACLKSMRDKQALAFTDIYDDEDKQPSPFLADLKKMSELGRRKLEARMEVQTGKPVVFREGTSRQDLERQYRRAFRGDL